MKIKIKKMTIILILFLIAIIASVSSVSAYYVDEDGNDNSTAVITDNAKNPAIISSLNVDNGKVLKTKNKVTYIKVRYKQKVNFRANAYSFEGKALKVKSASWYFNDNGYKGKGVTVSHTFKKSGWYTIKMNINATGKVSYPFLKSLGLSGEYTNATILDVPKTFKIYVSKEADLYTKKIVKYVNKGKNTRYLAINIANKGYSTSKPAYVKIAYSNSKLKKYTKIIKIPSIKSKKVKKLIIPFKIPSKYKKLLKYVYIDYKNKIKEFDKGNNKFYFR